VRLLFDGFRSSAFGIVGEWQSIFGEERHIFGREEGIFGFECPDSFTGNQVYFSLEWNALGTPYIIQPSA
jgi:hypothetical protein